MAYILVHWICNWIMNLSRYLWAVAILLILFGIVEEQVAECLH